MLTNPTLEQLSKSKVSLISSALTFDKLTCMEQVFHIFITYPSAAGTLKKSHLDQ